MNKSIYNHFLMSYLLIGVLSFFVVTAGGSYLIEKYLEKSLGFSLYNEACSIASSDILKDSAASGKPEEAYDALKALAVFRKTDIWLLDSEGTILYGTDRRTEPKNARKVKDFSPSSWEDTHWESGTFYDFFSTPRLSTVVPLTPHNPVGSYVAVHYSFQNIYQRRSGIIEVMILIFFVVYLITLLLLLAYHSRVHRPLQQILKGTSEYANGNLGYSIPVHTEDEMGYLANSLNYMADKLNKNGEYQRHFIANVSHDFRSPLTSIKGYVEAMLDGTIPPEMQEKYLKIIAFESERLEKLTRSLLTLNELDVKKRMMHMRRFDINEIIQMTAAAFEGICKEKNLRLELLLCGKELFVRADMEQIQQVLYNLLDNAIKFSTDNSSIVLETTERNGKAFLSVKDHGCGIPKESLSKIWDRFYKIDFSRGKDRKGTGLGLSIVKEIINAHEQHINVISTEDVGTEFIFTLEKSR